MRVATLYGPKETDEIRETIYRLDGPLRWALGENERIADLAAITAGQRALDVGAGTGYLTLCLANRVGPCGRVDALDVSPQLLDVLGKKAIARGSAGQVSLHVGVAQALPFDDATFDVAVSSYLLHELADDAGAMLLEMFRVLKPGGRIVLADFRRIEDDQRLREIEAWYGAQQDGGGPNEVHLRFSLGELERLMLDSGFGQIKLETWADFHMHATARRTS